MVCVRNDGYEASLERNKIYAILPDDEAEREAIFESSTRAVRITCSQPIGSLPSKRRQL